MELPKTAFLIKDTEDQWIDIDGCVYAIDKRNGFGHKLIKKAQTTVFGYKYCSICYPNIGVKSKRVHRLVAEAFIPNPNKYNIVGHKNNIKSDNRVENLYWTTISENTKKAFDDGLLKNDKGFDDSQSIPVIMFDTYTNKQLQIFGSIKEAYKQTGISISTISRQSKYKRPVRKPVYFRFADDSSTTVPDTIGMFDFETDVLLKVFYNSSDACNKTGINQRVICQHVQNNRKPLKKYYNVYFKKLIANKCEQTIELPKEK